MTVQLSGAQRRPVMAGNWKMFKTTAEARQFTEALHNKVKALPQAELPEVILCPPFTALSVVKEVITRLKAPFALAAQTMESKDNGAYTGEVSPVMLTDVGVTHVVIGHSERRQYYNETDATVNAKTKAALAHGLTPIVCVGELLTERDAGKTDEVIRRQVEKALEGVSPADFETLIIAYEPVWAIGTGKVCEADEANRVCGLIRGVLNQLGNGSKTRILYGGSVKPDNVKGLMAQADIDGGLVGGASLEPDSFFQLIEGASLVHA